AVEREQQAIEKERQKAIKKKDEPYPRRPTWKFNRGTLTSTPSIATLNAFYTAGHEGNLVGAATSKDHPRKIVFAKAVGQAVRAKYE
ncbi:unnamed protein product, partial [Pylaiella littoralis]